MDLSETQRLLSEVIRGGNPAALISEIVPGGGLSADEALGVYREGYIARLTEALGECYEAVWRVLGDEDFFAACAEFIAGQISHSYNLSRYGDEFPGFIETARPEFPFLKDLALFERAYRAAFHAPEIAADLRAASEGNPGSLVFEFTPSFRHFSFSSPVLSVWEFRNTQGDAPELDWTSGESFYLARRNYQLFVHRLSEKESKLLEAIVAGSTLGAALDRLGEALTPEEAQAFFQGLISSGAVARIRPAED